MPDDRHSSIMFRTGYRIALTLLLLLTTVITLLLIKFFQKKLSTDCLATVLITLAMLLHAFYIIRIDVFTLQHDVGTFSDLNDGITNGGHLGYIEYFLKHKAMPDFNPFDVFSYYHPPLHHILASIYVDLHLLLGCSYSIAFESIQILTLAFGGISMIFSYKSLLLLNSILNSILKNTDTSKILFPLCLILFHPSFIYISVSVNNDAITIMLICITIYFCLRYIKGDDFASIMHIALFLGLSVIGKMNAAVYAFPIGLLFLVRLYYSYKNKQLSLCIKRYLCFICVCAPISLSYTIRNYIRFREKPGILSANPDSFLYIGNYSLSERLLLPKDLGLSYPFHSIYGRNNGNTWLILLRTSLFSELWPEDTPFTLHSAQLATVAASVFAILIMCAAVIACVILVKEGKKELSIWYISSIIILPLTYIAFVIKYPYTCSCDFRYLASYLFLLSFGYLIIVNQKSKLLRYLLYISQSVFIISAICTCLSVI